ncbi:MAG TPA: glycosyl hydrolase family 18 protein [Solirubrobacteraceae bacterium]|nr:glycosyl hydrolase family 18 protein [Solirubrobacteraceae bacterium]
MAVRRRTPATGIAALAGLAVAVLALVFVLTLTVHDEQAQAASARSHRGSLQAFLLAGAPDSFADLQAHAASIGVVYPTYFDCSPVGGAIIGEANPQITAYTRAHHLKVMPRFNCQDGEAVHTILTDPTTRRRVLSGLVRIAKNPAYAGLNLDLENDGVGGRAALTSFVTDLAAQLHLRHKQLSVDVVGVTADDLRHSTAFYDDQALSAVADTVFVVAWGTHWAGSLAGPIGDLQFVDGVATYIASLPNARKFVLGVPMYGLDWPNGGGPANMATAYQYSGVTALAHARHATPIHDAASDEMRFSYASNGVSHQVWYLDARAVSDRLRIGRAHGLAVGVWRLGAEDQKLWASSAVAG